MSFLIQANDPDAVHPRRMSLGKSGLHWATLRNALGEAPVPSAFMS